MKYKLWKLTLSFALAILASAALAIPALAAPVDPTPHTVKQSCGIPITIRSVGDEFLSWSETLSGDIIAYNRDTNNWYYAYISGRNIYPSNNKVKPIAPLFGSRADTTTSDDLCELFEVANYYRAQFESNLRPISLTSNRIPLLVMLVEFSDRELSDVYLTPELSTHTSFWSNEFFGSEGTTVNTYFAKTSHDFNLQFTEPNFTVANGFRVENPTSEVAFVEVRDGIVRVRLNTPHPNPAGTVASAFALSSSIGNAFDAAIGYVDLSGVPTTPGAGFPPREIISSRDFIMSTVIAGYESAASPTHLVPRMNAHAFNTGASGSLIDVRYGAAGEILVRTVQGNTNRYAMGIGAAVHEIGHLFGLPDLYGHFPVRASLGRFSAMCIGSHTSPPLLDPWSKTQLGFIEPIVIDASEHRIIDLYGIDTGSYNVVKVISDACPDQYFLIENRRLIGFDEPLRNSNAQNHGNIPRGEGGILIYHVDERVVRDERLQGGRRPSTDFNSNDLHRGVDLEAMMVPSGSSNSFDFNPFFVRGGLRYSFTDATTPNSNFHTPGLCNDHRRVTYDCHPQIVASGVSVQVNNTAGQVMEIEVGEFRCPTVAEGRLPDQVGGEGLRGAPWTLCECGVLTVGEGYINWTAIISPWHFHRTAINEVVFTGSILAGESLRSLFSSLYNVTTIKGLERFDTNNVTNMAVMFGGTSLLTSLDVSNWDTGSVIDMSNMFSGANSLADLDVSNWDTCNVADMSGMFWNANSLMGLDVSDWDTSSAINMAGMFRNVNYITSLDVSKWDTGGVINMSNMFSGASSLIDLDVSNWDTGSVRDVNNMFRDAISLASLDVSNWDTSNVTNMGGMFWNASSLASLDVSNWDTSNVTNMGGMFGMANYITSLDVSNWDTGNVWNMGGMFWHARSLANLDVSNWDTGNVTIMSDVFSTTQLPNLDVSNWDTGNVITMSNMFWGVNSLIDLDVSNWDTGNVTNMRWMFWHASSLTSLDVSNWDTSSVRDMGWMFEGTASLIELDLANWDTGNVTNTSGMFRGTISLKMLTLGENFAFRGAVDLPNVRTTPKFTGYWQNVGRGTSERPRGEHVLTSAQLMAQFDGATMADTWVWQPVGDWCPIVAEGRFADQVGGEGLRGAPWTLCECGMLTVSGGFINWTGPWSPWLAHRTTISEIVFAEPLTAGTSLSGLFSSLTYTTIIEGLEYFDTSNVTDMSLMFVGVRSLASLDLSNFNTSNVVNMSSMFNGASLLTTLDLSNFDTGNVINMGSMFADATSLTSLNMSGWDIGNVTNMNSMFRGTALTSLCLSNFDMGRVTNVGAMFGGASALRVLVLGENFKFITTSGFPAGLPAVRAATDFTGYWQNVGDGTVEQPNGEHVLTSAQLMAQFDGATMADTWVWQPR